MPLARDQLSRVSYEAQEFVTDVHNVIRKKETGALLEDNDEIENEIEAIAMELDALLSQSIEWRVRP
jgi:hypothetical protein